ncbi:OLC1v1026999C1 [Oldenlandia corymbosa var. corymbosa]|uniref:OLC1v1026999C1 n=1 Tax=Oldenlandia corymbosa var. corymbosa TaxID=529605 RepID=A0AAV1C8Q5_OLDCO|nr:OLC1v1026999C1 [Oldenlandia corymbosa var. corymbosa]
MDIETITLITQGCKMAKDLEATLPNMATQHEYLLNSCNEIISVFIRAKERINSKAQMGVYDPIASGVAEWLSSSQTPAMHLLQAQHLLAGGPAPGSSSTSRNIVFDPKVKGVLMQDDQDLEGGAGGTLAEVVAARRGFPANMVPEVADATTSGPRGGGASSSSSQRPRRRDGAGTRVVREPAPQMGNTEIPPEDGFTWRKYGQKAILHSRFPRSYFRCTHQKLYKCPAKKQVQRLDTDPNTFEITYRGDHTCHLSSTAPSVPPPPLLLHNQLIAAQQDATLLHHISAATSTVNLTPAPPSSVLMTQWLSMDIGTGGGGQRATSNIIDLAGASITNAAAAGPSGSGLPFGRAHINVEEQPRVADMADAMFNSGSSSNNSMDLIFSSMDNK